MQVVVLGAGVVGVTSAYYLAAAGHDVTVIDRAAEPASGTSYANGGQLSYSFTDALARPSFLASVPGLLLGRDPAVRVALLAKPAVLGWGLRFLAQCTSRRARRNTLELLHLAGRSAVLLRELRAQTGIEFAFGSTGKLVLLSGNDAIAEARATVELKRQHGCETELLSWQEARRLEPALEGFRAEYAGAVYARRDEVGDARLFTIALGEWLAARGVALRLRETVTSLATEHGRVVGVRTNRGERTADAVVVCLGPWSSPLLCAAGAGNGIYPVRGYSLTLPCGRGAPAVSITDTARRLLFCPLGRRMRVAGFADFVGFDARRDPGRAGELRQTARDLAPDAADYAVPDDRAWAGARPMTPDGRPRTGATVVPGLFVNCGHGMLGWTLACATGHDLASAVTSAGERRLCAGAAGCRDRRGSTGSFASRVRRRPGDRRA